MPAIHPTQATSIVTESSDLPAALAKFDSLPDSAHVRLPVVAALFQISPATAWRWSKASRLPKPVKLGPNTTGWRVGDLRHSLARLAVAA